MADHKPEIPEVWMRPMLKAFEVSFHHNRQHHKLTILAEDKLKAAELISNIGIDSMIIVKEHK